MYIADLYNIGYGNLDLKTNLAFFRTIQAPYRGRLGQIILVDPPSAIWVALKIIKPFLKPETLEKVMFVTSAELSTVLPPILGRQMTTKVVEEIEENHDKESSRWGSVFNCRQKRWPWPTTPARAPSTSAGASTTPTALR